MLIKINFTTYENYLSPFKNNHICEIKILLLVETIVTITHGYYGTNRWTSYRIQTTRM